MIIMKRYNAYNSISQMPVVLIPIEFDRQNSIIENKESSTDSSHLIENSFQHSVVLRTFLTKDFMTGRPALPGETFPIEMLDEINETILKNVSGISRVLYDLTSKPPGINNQSKKDFLYFINFF
jgi:GMP synthase (glutamine-hydrolysing)